MRKGREQLERPAEQRFIREADPIISLAVWRRIDTFAQRRWASHAVHTDSEKPAGSWDTWGAKIKQKTPLCGQPLPSIPFVLLRFFVECYVQATLFPRRDWPGSTSR